MSELGTRSVTAVLASALAFWTWLGAASAEQGTWCKGVEVHVVTEDLELAGQTCDIALRATSMLKQCYLSPSRSLEIWYWDGVGASDYVAHFNPIKNRIKLPVPEQLAELFPPGSAFLRLSTKDLFESVVVHELAHAFFYDTQRGREICLAGHEYIAYALQIDFLPPSSRDALLEGHPEAGAIKLDWFEDKNLEEYTDLFAVNAWRHFSRFDNKCNLVSGFLSGEIVFPSENE